MATASGLTGLAVFAASSLLTGAGYVERELPGGLPMGNLLAGLSIASPAIAALLLSRHATGLRGLSWVATVLAVAWLPASVWLAGNLDLNFQGSAGDIWVAFSFLAFATSWLALELAGVQRLVGMLRRRGSRGA